MEKLFAMGRLTMFVFIIILCFCNSFPQTTTLKHDLIKKSFNIDDLHAVTTGNT